MIEVHCAVCDAYYGAFDKRTLPKKFVCRECNVGQRYTPSINVMRTAGNNHNGHELPASGGGRH